MLGDSKGTMPAMVMTEDSTGQTADGAARVLVQENLIIGLTVTDRQARSVSTEISFIYLLFCIKKCKSVVVTITLITQ